MIKKNALTVGGCASLSAPESLTRVHEDITSQVRVSGTERDASVNLDASKTEEDPLRFNRGSSSCLDCFPKNLHVT